MGRLIHVVRVRNRKPVLLLKEFVDDGEAEAIALVLEADADLLLIDDHEARGLAKKLGPEVMGTLGVIALARYSKLIREAKPIIDELVKTASGYPIRRLRNSLENRGEY